MWNPKFAGLKNDGIRGRGIQFNINPASPIESVREIYDPKGNYLISEMIFCDNPLLLVGVYAPNKDIDEWWEELYEKIDALNYRDVIIIGDFNQIMDPEMDSKNYKSDVKSYKPKCRSLLKSWLDSETYVDVFRDLNATKKEYTWTKFSERYQPIKNDRKQD